MGVSYVQMQESRFESNAVKAVGGAVLLHKGSTVDLMHSTFQANFAPNSTDDGVGFVNLGGVVRCEAVNDCLPICTACASSPPTPPPTPIPTPAPQSRAKWSLWPFGVLLGVLGCIVAWAVGAVVVWRRAGGRCSFELNSHRGASELSSNQQSLLASNTEPESSLELVARSVIQSHETSPAPVFVVDGSMRLTLWSPGMKIAAPMLQDPVGCFLSELPFVNAIDGYRLIHFLERIFEAPAEHDKTRICMLHLRAQNKHVLLEMVATHFFVTATESIVVMTGRQVCVL